MILYVGPRWLPADGGRLIRVVNTLSTFDRNAVFRISVDRLAPDRSKVIMGWCRGLDGAINLYPDGAKPKLIPLATDLRQITAFAPTLAPGVYYLRLWSVGNDDTVTESYTIVGNFRVLPPVWYDSVGDIRGRFPSPPYFSGPREPKE